MVTTSVRELEVRYRELPLPAPSPATITTSRDAVAYIRAVTAGSVVERAVVVHLGPRCHVVGVEQVGVGGIANTPVDPASVFRGAILAGATTIIFGHCHPSGIATPSTADIALTMRLLAAGELLGIRVVDHVIVTDTGDYWSFADMGQLKQPPTATTKGERP